MGFPCSRARHILSLVESNSLGELFDEDGDLPRENPGAKVYTSTPYPADKAILFHDGTPIEDAVVAEISAISEQQAVRFQW